MDAIKFKELADQYGVDTYGNVFADGGWGLCFSFDIAIGLSTWLEHNHNGQWSEEYAALCSLRQAPISYNPGMNYFDPEYYQDDDENYIACLIYWDLNPQNWEQYFEALKWFCEQEKE